MNTDIMPIGLFASTRKGAGELGASLDAVRRLRVPTVQLGAPRQRSERREAGAYRRVLEDAGIRVTVVFCGFEGSSYETVELVKETVGLSPRNTRAVRLAETLEMADFAAELGCDAIGMHLGVLPGDSASDEYRDLVQTVREVCDHCSRAGQRFHLETGQETAAELLEMIRAVERSNLAVNFDPANMILYGTGNPIEALTALGPHVRSVHCKDATIARQPGQKWYEDCPLGTGDVDVERFVRTLWHVGYRGPLTIEREYSRDQENDLAHAIKLLEEIKAKTIH